MIIITGCVAAPFGDLWLLLGAEARGVSRNGGGHAILSRKTDSTHHHHEAFVSILAHLQSQKSLPGGGGV